MLQSKRAAYGDDEDNPPTPSDDSDFDDDEDPDNLEVPGRLIGFISWLMIAITFICFFNDIEMRKLVLISLAS